MAKGNMGIHLIKEEAIEEVTEVETEITLEEVIDMNEKIEEMTEEGQEIEMILYLLEDFLTLQKKMI